MWGFLVVLMMVLSETKDRNVGESLSVGKSELDFSSSYRRE